MPSSVVSPLLMHLPEFVPYHVSTIQYACSFLMSVKFCFRFSPASSSGSCVSVVVVALRFRSLKVLNVLIVIVNQYAVVTMMIRCL